MTVAFDEMKTHVVDEMKKHVDTTIREHNKGIFQVLNAHSTQITQLKELARKGAQQFEDIHRQYRDLANQISDLTLYLKR